MCRWGPTQIVTPGEERAGGGGGGGGRRMDKGKGKSKQGEVEEEVGRNRGEVG